jgi:S1-C subfamily serine protease
MLLRSFIIILLATGTLAAVAQDAPLPSLEQASRKLLDATVTVRVRNPIGDDDVGQPAEADPAADPVVAAVTVCTGIVVDKRLVISPVFAAADSQIRITLRTGQQLTAVPKVLDQYTGLALLETQQDLPGRIARTDDPPAAGAWVLSAAAWGTEGPAVSVGILSASQRTLAGTNYPPLLQCDLRTAETSSGAGVVDRQGHLIGIVVATDAQHDHRGWTYAVPSNHIQRLLTVREEDPDRAGVVILKRRRPVIGMVLDGVEDTVVVSRVFEQSPAERAGIRVGDQMIAADGTMIRSVYQAVRPMLFKQPGDTMTFQIQRDGKTMETTVVLGGGIELPAAPFANVRQYLRPTLDVRQVGEGAYAARRGPELTREVLAPQSVVPLPEEKARPASAAEKIQWLKRALEQHQQAILALQKQLQEQEQQYQQAEQQLRSLQQPIEPRR